MRFPLLLAAAAIAIPAAAQNGAGSPRDLAAAQAAAWGRPGSTTYRIDNENVMFSGGRLLRTAFGPVLVAEGRVKDFGHPSPGRIGVFYLRQTPRGYVRGRAFPSAVVGGSMGGIGEWSVSGAFTANPVIFTEGGMSNMGQTCSFTTLTELTPAGPVKVASFQSQGSYIGGIGGRAYDSTGKIANIVRERSFDVVFTGSNAGRDRYVKRGARYVLSGAKPRLDGC